MNNTHVGRGWKAQVGACLDKVLAGIVGLIMTRVGSSMAESVGRCTGQCVCVRENNCHEEDAGLVVLLWKTVLRITITCAF